MTAIHIGLCVLLSVCALSVSERDLRDVQAYQAVKGVIDDYNGLVDLFESVEQFLNRLEIYTKVPHTVAMTEIIVKILVELLSILALTTKQIKQGRTSKSVLDEILFYLTQRMAEKIAKKFLGEKDIEAVLKRLDRLTQDEARSTAAQTLEVVYGLVQNMKVVMDGKQIHWLVARSVTRIPMFLSRRQIICRWCQGCSRYVLLATIEQLFI